MDIVSFKYAAYSRSVAQEISRAFPACLAQIVAGYAIITHHEYFLLVIDAIRPILVSESLTGHRTIRDFDIFVELDSIDNNNVCCILFKPHHWSMPKGIRVDAFYFNSYEGLLDLTTRRIEVDHNVYAPRWMLYSALAQIQHNIAELPIWPTRPSRARHMCTIL